MGHYTAEWGCAPFWNPGEKQGNDRASEGAGAGAVFRQDAGVRGVTECFSRIGLQPLAHLGYLADGSGRAVGKEREVPGRDRDLGSAA